MREAVRGLRGVVPMRVVSAESCAWFHASCLSPCATGAPTCTMSCMEPMRNPYVGEGADGAFRSAAIDESEAECLDSSDPRVEELRASARRWREQAAQLSVQK